MHSPGTIRWPVTLSILLVLVTGCGGASVSSEQPSVVATEKPAISGDEVIAKVYDNNYKLPADFFIDERADTPRSYTVYHVKDASLSYELCTNDYNEALAWEDADNSARTVNGSFVGAYENEQYFEFIRELSYLDDVGNVQGVTSPGFARVFKCASIDRGGVDRNLRYGHGGVLNARPLTAAFVRQFAEYLWQFTYFDNPKRKVLDSFTSENPQAIEHTLRLAFVINQGFDRCDRIEIIDWVFSASRENGQVDRRFDLQAAFEARLVDGVPERCQ